jgi:F0F1-type ATP synthase membrane subunit a
MDNAFEAFINAVSHPLYINGVTINLSLIGVLLITLNKTTQKIRNHLFLLGSIAENIYSFVLKIFEDLGPKLYKNLFPIFLSLFTILLVANILGLFPFAFSLTGHLAVTVILAFMTFTGWVILGLKSSKLHHNKNYYGLLGLTAPLNNDPHAWAIYNQDKELMFLLILGIITFLLANVLVALKSHLYNNLLSRGIFNCILLSCFISFIIGTERRSFLMFKSLEDDLIAKFVATIACIVMIIYSGIVLFLRMLRLKLLVDYYQKKEGSTFDFLLYMCCQLSEHVIYPIATKYMVRYSIIIFIAYATIMFVTDDFKTGYYFLLCIGFASVYITENLKHLFDYWYYIREPELSPDILSQFDRQLHTFKIPSIYLMIPEDGPSSTGNSGANDFKGSRQNPYISWNTRKIFTQSLIKNSISTVAVIGITYVIHSFSEQRAESRFKHEQELIEQKKNAKMDIIAADTTAKKELIAYKQQAKIETAAKLAQFQKQSGWSFPWPWSSGGSSTGEKK